MAHGQFCWHEINTNDKARAIAFYTELLGWKTREQDMGGMMYTIIHNGYNETGGIVVQEAGDPMPSHWLPCIEVTSCADTVAQVKELGGKVVVGPMPIPNTGDFAVIADDQGAHVSVMAFEKPMESSSNERPRPGEFCWYTLAVRDVEAAKKFWNAITGWTTAPVDLGTHSEDIFSLGDNMIGGIQPLAADDPAPNHWALAIAVADLDDTLARATKMGANTVVPPMTVGSFGRMSVVTDPTGAMISFFQGAEG